ncbi:Wzz/FepE/Etk N-terminal domain-containing protein [Prochlorococcus marinus]|uniref:Wzz/FepE/Etk N-terminal domain-containing protein n=1 Tax=Prochlorococcus marinus TaxID=1219 RepID=UPI001ADBE5DF|nr:Wzz/FepE/Etk N-terminal domain-containing protein [Prochlorococcus marinus]MBO8204947.1 hypothetical protein [Prochlorococcus marinus CUG1415]MBW3044219.1 hypothetical protein [Prochlorococcus marinus str. MU1415]
MLKQSLPSDNDNELDVLQSYFKFLSRNRYLLLKILAFSAFLSTIYSFLAQKIWQGEFQILLRDTSSSTVSKLLEVDPTILNLLGANEDKKLNTEVQILKSPSVLFENFNFVKESKISKGQQLERWRYADWLKSSVKVELIKGTSVLNLVYRDSDKDLILPVLQKISNSYQKYSGKDRINDLNNGVIYLKDQIKKYKFISEDSLSKAENFAINNDLLSPSSIGKNIDFAGQNSLNLGEENLDSPFKPTEFGASRVSAASSIRRYDEIIEKLQLLENDNDFYAFVKIVYPLKKNDFNYIDSELESLRNVYKENDFQITRLKKIKSNLIKNLRIEVPRYFGALKIKNQTIVAAAKRPQEILVKYQSLIRNANRDVKVYETLQSQLRVLELEKQKIKEPWNLITEPTLFPNPVEPIKKRIVFLGSFLGLLIGLLISYLKEKKGSIIFDQSELNELLPISNIINLSDLIKNNEETSIQFLVNNLYEKHENEKISFLFLGDLDNQKLSSFSERLNNKINKDIISSPNILDSKKQLNDLIIITSLGLIKKNDIELLLLKINLQGININSCILI